MLSAAAVAQARPKAQQYKLWDERGLYLLVMPNGRRYWRLNYRFAGKAKTISLGVFPDVGLAVARDKREEARKLVAQGEDPCAARRRSAVALQVRQQGSLDRVADEYIERLRIKGRSTSTVGKNEWLLDHVRPDLGRRLMSEISAPDLLKVLQKVEASGRYETANRLRGTLSSLFRYAIASGRADRDPAADLRGALIVPRVKHRAAITEPKAVGGLLRAIAGYEGSAIVRIALQLSAHLFTRPGELRLAEWSEFDFEIGVWSIPGERTKMRRPHKVPLSDQAISLFEELEAITGDGRLLFPSVRSADRAMSDNTLNAALSRLGYGQDEMTAHGFRAMAATLLNECGQWHPDAIERQLGHVEGNDVRRAYVRGEHWDERVRMMNYWSGRLGELEAGGAVIRRRFARTGRG
ncbi:tyrosine-type recombinase/integrase [Sphingopyxis kveilinensis]|uniref:tyrosine-type recombinase/integrase n=1 Tax=Sphingopyxis kveilinensis TaxID=3114367 RepID=UPI0030D2080A